MSYQFPFALTSFPSNIVLPGRIVQRIISLCAQKDNKYNLHDFLLYINIIISYSFKEFAKMIACMWTGNATILNELLYCDWLKHNHVVLQKYSSHPLLRSMEFQHIYFIFYTIQMPVCCVGCLMVANTWTSPYTSGILLSWKTKNELVFFRINLWTQSVQYVSTIPVKMPPIDQFEKFFLNLLNFKVNFFWKSIYGHLFRSRIVRHTLDKGEIICPSEGADR